MSLANSPMVPIRLPGLVFALALVAGAAGAAEEAWKLYTYPEQGYGLDFPAPPKIEDRSYTASQSDDSPKSTAPARIYSVTLPTAIYKLTVADFSQQKYDDGANILGQAVDFLTNTENLRVDTSDRLGMRAQALYGRHVTYDRKDGARVTAGYFFTKGKLYVIEAIILPNNPDIGSPDALRFAHSLCFLPRC